MSISQSVHDCSLQGQSGVNFWADDLKKDVAAARCGQLQMFTWILKWALQPLVTYVATPIVSLASLKLASLYLLTGLCYSGFLP